MFIKLLLAFTIIPLLELALLIKIGEYIGLIPTILLVGLTGVLGVSLARSQGFIVVRKIKESLQQGKMPADDLLAGLLILIGGTMLLTPGLLTDLTGFSLIIPFTRGYYTGFIKKRFVNYLRKNNISYSNGFNEGDDDYIDIEIEKEK
ncbi:FxsA family protein [Iocasia frigidifontis]|uniref:FxsA family protein n=1 Tax=Iocasia fonsfrigidae TaxID=2682810 RepID=A0A8A7KL04_9FIRM|nr:FxsA family protein [Iocasia fonsfrigidae]QTL99517.1 FxsA family protein [Iocasia fonsfrigidae]